MIHKELCPDIRAMDLTKLLGKDQAWFAEGRVLVNTFVGTEGQKCSVVNVYQHVAMRGRTTQERTRLFRIIMAILSHLKKKHEWIVLLGDWNAAFQNQRTGYASDMKHNDEEF
eukprot:1981289-Rhodomonas_salina.2